MTRFLISKSITMKIGTFPNNETVKYSHDANGNISELLDLTAILIVHYEYDAAGNITSFIAPCNEENSYRFNIKPLDSLVGFYYYGYRFYDSQHGRWSNNAWRKGYDAMDELREFVRKNLNYVGNAANISFINETTTRMKKHTNLIIFGLIGLGFGLHVPVLIDIDYPLLSCFRNFYSILSLPSMYGGFFMLSRRTLEYVGANIYVFVILQYVIVGIIVGILKDRKKRPKRVDGQEHGSKK